MRSAPGLPRISGRCVLCSYCAFLSSCSFRAHLRFFKKAVAFANGAPTFLSAWAYSSSPADRLADKNVGAPKNLRCARSFHPVQKQIVQKVTAMVFQQKMRACV
jgi:hypothetical protein